MRRQPARPLPSSSPPLPLFLCSNLPPTVATRAGRRRRRGRKKPLRSAERWIACWTIQLLSTVQMCTLASLEEVLFRTGPLHNRTNTSHYTIVTERVCTSADDCTHCCSCHLLHPGRAGYNSCMTGPIDKRVPLSTCNCKGQCFVGRCAQWECIQGLNRHSVSSNAPQPAAEPDAESAADTDLQPVQQRRLSGASHNRAHYCWPTSRREQWRSRKRPARSAERNSSSSHSSHSNNSSSHSSSSSGSSVSRDSRGPTHHHHHSSRTPHCHGPHTHSGSTGAGPT
jgi:hypothetical protein